MTEWHDITAAEIDRLYPALESAVEMMTDYGREKPDWDRIISSVEDSEENLDLGSDMNSPEIRALLRKGRQVYREMKEQL